MGCNRVFKERVGMSYTYPTLGPKIWSCKMFKLTWTGRLDLERPMIYIWVELRPGLNGMKQDWPKVHGKQNY